MLTIFYHQSSLLVYAYRLLISQLCSTSSTQVVMTMPDVGDEVVLPVEKVPSRRVDAFRVVTSPPYSFVSIDFFWLGNNNSMPTAGLITTGMRRPKVTDYVLPITRE